MKRRLLTVLFAVTLILSGSGAALAAELCAGHAAGRKDPCCRKEAQGHGGGHETGEHSEHSQADNAGSRHCEGSARKGGDVVSHARGAVMFASIAVRAGFCAHCLVRSENLPASRVARANDHGRRDSERHVVVRRYLVDSDARPFISAITPKQGSPPIENSRRRLLLGVLLI